MEHIRLVYEGQRITANPRPACDECQTSCQSACKTSCTVGNQVCRK
ncbi:MAG: six-cysteine peptide SCIFF [Firmicutes bacterium]|nr:six-cysteine peptide SCIFF [Bacillota bacterium]